MGQCQAQNRHLACLACVRYDYSTTLQLMVDLNLYRCRIGSFNPILKTKQSKNLHNTGESIPVLNLLSFNYQFMLIYIILMMYYILGMASLLFSMQLSVLEPNCDFRYLEGTYYHTFNSSYVANNKLLYVLLLSFLIRRVIASRRYSVFLTCLKLNWSSPLKDITCSGLNVTEPLD